MGDFSHEVLPGGLSQADHDRIFALAEKGLGAQRISRVLKKHPSTVQWFMQSNGLRPLLPSPEKPLVYQRGGKDVRRFSAAEDAFIEQLRIDGLAPAEIAPKVAQRFGFTRNAHSIRCRLIMLGANEEA